MRYRVIYLWRNERHQLISLFTKDQAIAEVQKLRLASWVAWFEANSKLT